MTSFGNSLTIEEHFLTKSAIERCKQYIREEEANINPRTGLPRHLDGIARAYEWLGDTEKAMMCFKKEADHWAKVQDNLTRSGEKQDLSFTIGGPGGTAMSAGWFYGRAGEYEKMQQFLRRGIEYFESALAEKITGPDFKFIQIEQEENKEWVERQIDVLERIASSVPEVETYNTLAFASIFCEYYNRALKYGRLGDFAMRRTLKPPTVGDVYFDLTIAFMENNVSKLGTAVEKLADILKEERRNEGVMPWGGGFYPYWEVYMMCKKILKEFNERRRAYLKPKPEDFLPYPPLMLQDAGVKSSTQQTPKADPSNG